MRRRPNTQTVQWFLELAAQGALDLNPAYQRRSVWNDEYRRYYIDTVLRDYPSPAIYLQVETRAGQATIYHVIDGKQRLETLTAFSQNEFHLGNRFSDEGLDAPYYDDLPPKMQEAFVDYVLSVENITRAEPAELTGAFDRLNRNTAKLNRQELRKAQYEGKFITKMTELAADPFWADLGMASRARVSRMLDVQYVSEIYLLSMLGVLDGNDNLLDDYYALFDTEIPNEEATDLKFKQTQSWVASIPLELRATRWTNLGDFYSLWDAYLINGQSFIRDVQRVAARLEAFEQKLLNPSSPSERRYSDAVRQGTNKDTSRTARAEIISKILLAE